MRVWLILTTISALFNVFSVYIAVTALNTFRRRTPWPEVRPGMRFAVVIPARNEARVIGSLLDALDRQNYPSGRVDVYVALNHCTDDTARIAKARGAKLIACSDAVACKGDVLHETIAQLMPMPYDAFVFFDADNLPDRNFLRRMNDAMTAGERVCKARLKAGNAKASWVAGCYGLYHALMEWTYSRPHTIMGCSSNLVGTGFAVHREVFEALGGWNTQTLCEDSEFAGQASRAGYRVAFVPEAISYDEQVERFGTSLRQRRRWCSGMVMAARTLLPSMFSKACPNRRVARDFGMLYLTSLTMPIGVIAMLISLFRAPRYALISMGVNLLLSALGIIALSVALCPLSGYRVREMWRAIVLNPIFTLSWIPLQIIALFVPVKTWSVIEHNGQKDVAGPDEPAH